MEIDEVSIRGALEEIERLIATRVVVGETVTFNDYAIIPLCSCGFGLGAGRGGGDLEAAESKAKPRSKRDRGWGSGLGMGGGVRPIGVIIAGPDGVRVESLGSDQGITLEKLGAMIAKIGAEREP